MQSSAKSTSKIQKDIPKLRPGQIVECRGAIWRFISEDAGFWELELLKHGASFAESQVRVWALPALESESIKVIDSADAICPEPTKDQLKENKALKPTLASHKARVIRAEDRASDATTAAACAINHKPWQFEPWKRIVEVLPFPRLLIADDVGLGKTTEAAIILAELARRRRADRVLIVAPQHLCEKWQSELINRFGLVFEIFNRETRERMADRGVANPWEVVERVIVSRDFVKRWENLKPISNVTWDMVVIDECHHFVKDDSGFSTRLRDFAERVAWKSPGLLLLSATPFTGNKSEFESLISLLDPKYDEGRIPWDPKSPLMVRRLKKHLQGAGEKFLNRELQTLSIKESDLSKDELQLFREVNESLESLAKDSSETWRHLQVETLRKRLSSSWAAFMETCSDESLGSFFNTSTKSKIKKLVDGFDSAKLRAVGKCLKDLHKTKKTAKVVIFTEAIPSQSNLAKYLVDKCGYRADQVAVIEGQTDRVDRLKIEDNFANANSDLLVLIATDTISEGKDLQHACHHLMHLELPWSFVKIEQRNGRIDRLGQQFTPMIINTVLDLSFTPDQRVLDKLSRKLIDAEESLGSVSPILDQNGFRFEELKKAEKDSSELFNDAKLKILAEMGLDVSAAQSLAPVPINHRDDSRERRTLLDLIISELGGQLRPNGNNPEEDRLSLPDERWPLPEYLLETHGYPTSEKPWRVTFSAEHYLKYEKHLLSGGVSLEPLVFISPIHPVVTLAEARYRFRMARRGYPVFSVQKAPAKDTVVVEFTLRSPKGRIVTQSLEFLDLKTLERLDPSSYGDLVGGGRNPKLPNSSEWKNLPKELEKQLSAFTQEWKTVFDRRHAGLISEQSKLDPMTHGLAERAQWIEELWKIDNNQSQFQILGLILAEKLS